MNNKTLYSVSFLFLFGFLLITFSIQGGGHISLRAIVEVAKGERSFINLFQTIERPEPPQITYPEAYFKYELTDQKTYYSKYAAKGFGSLYYQFVLTKSDEEIRIFIEEKNTNCSDNYKVNIWYDDENKRKLKFYLNSKELSENDIFKLFLAQYNYQELRNLFVERDMLHKSDDQRLQYLTVIFSFDKQGNFVNLRRR